MYNYLPVARALARAGAAVIVLDRTIQWEPLDEEANRDPSGKACAATWLLENAHLDSNRLMEAGPGNSLHCSDFAPGQCFFPQSVLNFGLTSPADYYNTEYGMMTLEGRVKLAKWVGRHLQLSQIMPEWLTLVIAEDSK